MAKINVLFLLTKATRGGAQRYVYDLATNAPRSEFDVIVAYGERGAMAHELAKVSIKLHEISSLRRDVALFSDLKSFREMVRTFRELRPDIIHLNSSKAAALGALAAHFVGIKKIVFTAHGWPFKEPRNIVSRGFLYLASWLTALLSSAVIVVSMKDAALAGRMWGVRKKVHYIPLGLSELSPAPPQEAYRAMFGLLPPAPITAKTLRLVTLAELTANKGLRYAIEAVALLRDRGLDIVYVIAGDGEEREALQSLILRRGLGEHVFLPGHIERAGDMLTGFDIFVLPSLKEGTSYALLEAAEIGIPIVATDVIDKDLVARLPSAMRVPRKDPQAIADAIAERAKSPRAKDPDNTLFPLSEMLRDTFRLYD